MNGVPARDRRLKRFRLLDLPLGLGTLGVLSALWNVLSFWQGSAAVTPLPAPVFTWMSWRQYDIPGGHRRINLLGWASSWIVWFWLRRGHGG